MPLKEFNEISAFLTYKSLDDVSQDLEEFFSLIRDRKWKSKWLSTFSPRDAYFPVSLTNQRELLFLWEPEMNQGRTVIMSNIGQSSLNQIRFISRMYSYSVLGIGFTVGLKRDQYLRLWEAKDGVELYSYHRIQENNSWVKFFDWKGPPSDKARYKKLLPNKLTPESIISYASQSGWRLDEEPFWYSQKAIVFEEMS